MKSFLYELVNIASEIHLKYFKKDISVRYKGKNNPVTQADKETEEVVKNLITKKFPQDKFICEESCPAVVDLKNETRYWLIDPLDGTVNYTHKLPIFCISIGIMENKEIVKGIVCNPVTREIFYAEKSRGAYKNEQRIFVSQNANLSKSLLVTGFPYYTYKNPKKVFLLFNKFAVSSQAVRRLGSAALDLCYVAEGIFDGFWEENLQPWDVAAGSLIVKEATGKVTDYSGGKNYIFGKQIVASNSKVHRQMLRIINSVNS